MSSPQAVVQVAGPAGAVVQGPAVMMVGVPWLASAWWLLRTLVGVAKAASDVGEACWEELVEASWLQLITVMVRPLLGVSVSSDDGVASGSVIMGRRGIKGSVS